MGFSYNKSDISGNLHTVFVSSGDYSLKTDDYTVVASDHKRVLGIATDAKAFTLPTAATYPGLEVTIINMGADGNNIITVSPAATDAIFGAVPASAGANADATTAKGLFSQSGNAVGKDFVNTKATALAGDFIKIKSDGGTKWILIGGQGVWASEA